MRGRKQQIASSSDGSQTARSWGLVIGKVGSQVSLVLTPVVIFSYAWDDP